MANEYRVSYAYVCKRSRTSNKSDVVVPFGARSLRESGGNHWGFGLGGRRI